MPQPTRPPSLETLRDLKTGRVLATTHFASFGALVEGRWSWIKDCMVRRYGCGEDAIGCTEDEFGNDLITVNGVPVACLGDPAIEYPSQQAEDACPHPIALPALTSAKEHAVTATAHHLQSAVSTLWKMRLDPRTSDEVMKEEGALLAALGTLRTLWEDIRGAQGPA